MTMFCIVEGCAKDIFSKKRKMCRGHSNSIKHLGSTKKRFWPAKTPEYNAWSGMKKRCYSNHEVYKHSYGMRNIVVCSGWKNSAKSFCADMGTRPSKDYSLDRIDNDGNYSCGHCEECIENGWPMNCRWATKSIQQRNRRGNTRITYKGETKTVSEWAHQFNIPPTTLYGRLKRGHPSDKLLEGLQPRDSK